MLLLLHDYCYDYSARALLLLLLLLPLVLRTHSPLSLSFSLSLSLRYRVGLTFDDGVYYGSVGRVLPDRSAADGKKYDVFFDDGQTEQSVKREEFLPGRRLLPKQAVCVRFEDDVTYYGRIVRRVGRDFPARYIVRFKNGDMQEGLVESEVLPGHRR